MFERLKRFLRESRKARGELSDTILEGAMITSVSARTAGSVAAVVTTSVDVVKMRIMLGAFLSRVYRVLVRHSHKALGF